MVHALLLVVKPLPTSQCMLTISALLQRAGAAAQFVEDLTLLEASRGLAQALHRRSGMGTPDSLPAVVSGQLGDVAAFGRLVVQLYRQRVLLEAPDNSRCASTCIFLSFSTAQQGAQPASLRQLVGGHPALLCPCDLIKGMAYCDVLAEAAWPPIHQCFFAVARWQSPLSIAQQREHSLPA